jgi:hypothetical protein
MATGGTKMSDPQPVWAQPGYLPGASTGTSLGGFFAGVVWLIVVPGLLLTLLNTLAPDDTTAGLLFAGMLAVTVPIALLFPGRTRRFAMYMLIGIGVTAIVVAGVVVAFVAMLTTGEGS